MASAYKLSLVIAGTLLALAFGCGNGGTGGDGGTGGNGGTGGGGGTVTGVANLGGWWVIQRVDTSAATVWGNARADLSTDYAIVNLFNDDGTEPTLTLREGSDGGLVGYWSTSILDFPNPPDQTNFSGTESSDGNTITGTWASDSGNQAVTLYRATAPDHRATGVWTRDSDSAALVAAYDSGSGFLMSLLDPSGDWPFEGHFNATIYSTVFGGLFGWDDFQGLMYDNASKMHLQITNGATSGMNFTKASSQSAINGRWVAGDRKWAGRTVSRWATIIVEHNNTLYMHDGGSRGYRASLSGGSYTDTSWGWSGRLSSSGNRIVGAWIGWPDWYNSMDRTVPPADDLSGAWHSVSLDWNHHTSTGDIIRAYGSATITHSGDSLTIVDTYDDGTTYEVEAEWQGDHYEGSWWNAATPANKSPWRGELLAGGWYLHGTWDDGEYSFAAFPLVDIANVATEVADSSAVILDPYEDTVAVVHDSSLGLAVNAYREQDRVSGFSFVTSSGEGRITIDERLRPTEIVTDAETITYVWSSDSSSVEVTVDQGGSTTTTTVNVDLSDAGLIALVNAAAERTGQDVTFLIDWINSNPGRIAAIAQGTEAPPGLEPSPSTSLAEKNKVGVGDPLSKAVTWASAVSGILGTAAGIAGASTATMATAILVAAAGAAALVVVGLLLAGLLYAIIEGCDPCNLGCFVHCI